MPVQVGDYALIGDTHTAGLVGTNGSVDWLCLPRFDAAASFAALLGNEDHGHWTLAPAGSPGSWRVTRQYVDDTLLLATTFECDEGEVRMIDCMPVRAERPELVRRVQGVRGRVAMACEFAPRFDYGRALPHLAVDGRRVEATAGPDRLVLDSGVRLEVVDGADGGMARAEFGVGAGETVDFGLSWCPARDPTPPPIEVGAAIERTMQWWRDWSAACDYAGEYRDAVVRSLITLKALTYEPSGGIVAAPTTSLPEELGGPRNWDYRYCWLRDATFTLLALLGGGYVDEARAWREWLLRAVSQRPEQLQVMYGVEGERRIPEVELDWLPGFAGSRPVRIGNRAHRQFQLDVYGELMDVLHQARSHGIETEAAAWKLQRSLMDVLESRWHEDDCGIWEMRGCPRGFTHSKVMAWVGADRAIRGVEQHGLDGPVEQWKRLRAEIFSEVCAKGFDAERGTFTQYFGSTSLDAALLLIPKVGFLPASDERVRGTTAAIERELVHDGFVHRYSAADASEGVDTQPHHEGAFLPCTFWLADTHILQGDVDHGRAIYERLLDVRNDVGLLSEEYNSENGCLVGNFPQALSHLSLVGTALDLAAADGPANRRSAAPSTSRASSA